LIDSPALCVPSFVCFIKDKGTEYERAVFRALSALVGEDRDVEVAIERHFEVRGGRIWKLNYLLLPETKIATD
jgi:hypothetical protein